MSRLGKRKRKWDDLPDDDPGAGLLNLFDVWIAFAVALLLATVGYFSAVLEKSTAASGATSSSSSALAPIQPARIKLDRFRVSKQSAGGDGERLGTAYRLRSGEVIYVPDSRAPEKASPSPR